MNLKDAKQYMPKTWTGTTDKTNITEFIDNVKNWADVLSKKGVEMLELVEVSKVPGPKYDIVTRFDLSAVKGFTWGSTPQVPLTPRQLEWKKVPGPGQYESRSPRDFNRARHIGSGPLTPRFDMCYIDPKTPGAGSYEVDRGLTPRHFANPRSAVMGRPDSCVMRKVKQQLEEIKATPSVGAYETSTGVEIGADNPARHRAAYFSRNAGRDQPAAGDPILEMVKVPSCQKYHPHDGKEIGSPRGNRAQPFARASRHSLVTGY